MKCPKCFNEIPNDSKLCPICGNIFASYFEEIKLTPKQKIKLFAHKILFPLILTTIILTTIIYIVTKHNIKMNRITDVNNLKKDETSANYINDLYISDGRHYKYLLNDKEKEIYNLLIEAIKNYQKEVEINISKYGITNSRFTTQTIKKIKDTITMDHPELIQLGSITQSTENKIIIKYVLNQEQQELEQIQNIIDEIKETTKNLTEYEKVKYVYDYLYNTEISNDIESNSAYGCLILKKCNNQGYSKTSQIILSNIKINSMIAIGQKNNKHHEWNIVKVEGKYYYYDQTLSKINEKISYNGLLFKNKNYELYYKKLMPTINGKKYLNK